MFDKNINAVKKLGEIECTIYEFSTAIFLRENSDIKQIQLQKISKIIDNKLNENKINIDEFIDNKNIIIEKYEKILDKFFVIIENLYANILEKLYQAEASQNVIYIKKITLKHFLNQLENTKTEEEKEILKDLSKKVNISLNNLDKKIDALEEKISLYDEIINICENEFQLCKYTRTVQVDKFLNEDLNIKNFNKFNFFETIDKKIKLLEEKIFKFDNNVEKYVINFISKIDKLEKSFS